MIVDLPLHSLPAPLEVAANFDVVLSFSTYWKSGMTWPPAEPVPDSPNKIKWFLRAHPGGAVEHFETQMTTTALYYEAM